MLLTFYTVVLFVRPKGFVIFYGILLLVLNNLAVLDQKFEEKLGSVGGKVGEKGESPAGKEESPSGKDESLAGTDDVKADKLKEQTVEGQEIEQSEKTSQKDAFARTIDEIRKVCCLLTPR